jgi:hypothetical protein
VPAARRGVRQGLRRALDAPPTEALPPGDVLRAGHLGREIGDTQNFIHFYTDLIGLGIVGARDVSKSNAPVYLNATVRSFFVPDPQGFWVEFMDRDVKRDPNAK